MGAQLLVRSNDILQQKEALQQQASLEQGIARGTLRITSFGTTSYLHLLPGLLASHPLASKAAISARDLHEQPFIHTRAGSGPYIDHFLAAEDAVPQTRFEQLVSMLGFVAQGHALTIAARLALSQAPPAGVVYRPLRPKQPRTIALAALRFDKRAPAARALVDMASKLRKKCSPP